MRLWWNHLWKSDAYRRATANERRLIEIRFCVARAVKARRRAAHLTQAALAGQIGTNRNTISRIERASNRSSLSHAVGALIALGCTDAEIGNVFNAAANGGVQQLHRRAKEPFFPKPAEKPRSPKYEHRFLHYGQCRTARRPLEDRPFAVR